VQRHDHDVRALVEDILRAVAMMDVDVEHGDTANPWRRIEAAIAALLR